MTDLPESWTIRITVFTTGKKISVQSQSCPSLLHVSTVAQVPVLALAKFNHGQLQCEFVQTVLVIKWRLHSHFLTELLAGALPTRLSLHCTDGSLRFDVRTQLRPKAGRIL